MSLCRYLQNFKPVEFEDVQQNFWSSRFFGTWSSETSSLWMLETLIRTSCLQNLQHLIRSTIFRGWDCSSELPVSESSEWLQGKSSEFADADDLLIKTTSSEAL